MIPLPETDLIDMAVEGDELALTRLLALTGPRVRLALRNAFHWNPDLELDDVMQLTYLEACQRISTFQSRGAGAFQGWLTQIARNNLNDAIRGLTRLKRTPPGQRVVANDRFGSSGALLDRLAVTSTTPSRKAATAEIDAVVQHAIRSLPQSYGQVIELLDLQGKSADEAATIMGRSRGAIYVLHCRGLDRLRERLVAVHSMTAL
jgi:RNA polymerase sigma factor (sigma-70 family)